MVPTESYQTKLKRRKTTLLNRKRKLESLMLAAENALERCDAELADIDRMLTAYEEKQ